MCAEMMDLSRDEAKRILRRLGVFEFELVSGLIRRVLIWDP